MTLLFNTQRLAARIKIKQGTRSLRDIAPEMEGVSVSTLSRIANGHTPDLQNMLNICQWLQVPPQEFIYDEQEYQTQGLSTLEQIELLLRTGTKIEDEAICAIMTFIKFFSREDRP